MRFIIREQEFEKIVASGLLRYEQDGRPTGAVEQWRLTEAAGGYRFLRVDLDAREASGDSYLYHLVLGPDGRPERLKFRFFAPQEMIVGDVLVEKTGMIVMRDVNRQHFEEEVTMDRQSRFWFPSVMGLSLLAHDNRTAETVPAVLLDKAADFAPRLVDVRLSPGEKETLAVAQQEVGVRPLSIRWQDQERTLWLDDNNRPVKMVRGDGLTAIETRYIQYR